MTPCVSPPPTGHTPRVHVLWSHRELLPFERRVLVQCPPAFVRAAYADVSDALVLLRCVEPGLCIRIGDVQPVCHGLRTPVVGRAEGELATDQRDELLPNFQKEIELRSADRAQIWVQLHGSSALRHVVGGTAGDGCIGSACVSVYLCV